MAPDEKIQTNAIDESDSATSGTRKIPLPTADATQTIDDGALVGTVIHDRYEVTELLGAGGMGAVYKGRHQDIGRLVAIKVLHPLKGKDPKAGKRFLQEAKAAAALNHQNLLSCYDFGLLPNDQPYLVMDFIRGESLAQVIKRNGPFPIEQAVPMFLQICDALTHAHNQGVVHRDLKPSNIMIVQDDHGQDVIKLVDFGIAKIESPGAQNLTETGDVFGSPLYMSPEQCSGAKIDLRSDIYSFGCVMYESLTGSVPFTGENVLQTIFMHVHNEPDPPSQLRKDLPPGLEDIILKCLSKEPDQRYQSAEQLRLAFIDWQYEQNREYIERQRLLPEGQAQKNKRSPLAMALAVSAAGLIIPAAIWFGCIYFSPENWGSRLVAEGDEFAARDNSAKAEQCYNQAISIFPPKSRHKAAALDKLATLLVDDGRYGDALKKYNEEIETLKLMPDKTDRELIKPLTGLGTAYSRNGRGADAKKSWEDAAEIAAKSAAEDESHGNFEQRLKMQEQLRDLFIDLHGADSPDVGGACLNLAETCSKLKDYQRARTYLLEGLPLVKKFPGDDARAYQISGLTLLYQVYESLGETGNRNKVKAELDELSPGWDAKKQ